ncbi:MAG: GGDEF domain-containing protein [Leptolyngbya sp. PLA3]|nr:GGDEF domain-containing protein [Leptolyngbya sp. PL-A3]
MHDVRDRALRQSRSRVASTRENYPGDPPSRGILGVIVGSQGDLSRLVRDAGFTLRRVPTLLDAVALLSSLPPEAGLDRIVLLSQGSASAQSLQDFIEALRHVDRTLSVAHIGPCEPQIRELVDGVVSTVMEPEEIRAIIDGRERCLPEMPVQVLTSTPMRRSRAGDIADALLVRKLMLGEDLLEPAVELLRGREPAAQYRHAAEPPTSGVLRAEVRCEMDTVGFIEAPGGFDAGVLNAHAAWLSAWLTLEARYREQRIEALTDPLTGAWNRRYFERYLSMAIEQAKQARLTVTVLVFDIDEFKQYNDAFGHAAGDEILRETVRMLRSVIRPSDRVCRIGGDEFAVIFYEPRGPRVPTSKPPESIYRLAKRFQSQISGHRFPKLGREAPGTLTISGGLATYPWDGQDPRTLLDRADELAIHSKKAGKNVITLGPGALRECVDPLDE